MDQYWRCQQRGDPVDKRKWNMEAMYSLGKCKRCMEKMLFLGRHLNNDNLQPRKWG
jgi:hypothetical protein